MASLIGWTLEHNRWSSLEVNHSDREHIRIGQSFNAAGVGGLHSVLSNHQQLPVSIHFVLQLHRQVTGYFSFLQLPPYSSSQSKRGENNINSGGQSNVEESRTLLKSSRTTWHNTITSFDAIDVKTQIFQIAGATRSWSTRSLDISPTRLGGSEDGDPEMHSFTWETIK